jgi:hypothetical protein
LSSSSLVRQGGLAAMAAGVLLAVGALLQNRMDGHLPAVVLYLGSLFLLGGLAGLHVRQAGLYGRTGSAGFWVAFVCTLLWTVLGLVVVLAEVFAGDRTSTAVALIGGFATALVRLAAGFGLLLMSIATLRARVLPLPWRLLPLVIFLVDVPMKPMVVLLLGADLRRQLILQEGSFAEILAFLVWDVPGVLVGLGWVMLGYALWSGMGEGVRRPAPVR